MYFLELYNWLPFVSYDQRVLSKIYGNALHFSCVLQCHEKEGLFEALWVGFLKVYVGYLMFCHLSYVVVSNNFSHFVFIIVKYHFMRVLLFISYAIPLNHKPFILLSEKWGHES